MSDYNVQKAGFTSSGIAGGSRASSMMSQEAKSSGGGVHSGGPTATLQEF
ncbi:PREDICTED: interferon alpha-inducible protein 6-like, partial [Apaloderma vittatum]